jgi:branched-chain amino acid aminotransferase
VSAALIEAPPTLPALWIDGRPQAVDGAHVSAFDRGLLLADGVFETMRVHRATAFRLDRHLARLHGALGALEIPAPPAIHRWIDAALAATRPADAAIRLTVTRGAGAGVAPPSPAPSPTVVLAVQPLPSFPARVYDEGLAAIVASGRRNQRAMTNGLKTLAYGDAVAAMIEARRAGADDALFLDTDDHCAEATASNLFAFVDGTLVTPPVACGALPGITREVVFELALRMGVPAAERPLALPELQGASEALLTSSLRGLAPLVRVDGRPVGAGGPGPVTRALRDAYHALVLRECGR